MRESGRSRITCVELPTVWKKSVKKKLKVYLVSLGSIVSIENYITRK